MLKRLAIIGVSIVIGAIVGAATGSVTAAIVVGALFVIVLNIAFN